MDQKAGLSNDEKDKIVQMPHDHKITSEMVKSLARDSRMSKKHGTNPDAYSVQPDKITEICGASKTTKISLKHLRSVRLSLKSNHLINL